MDAPPKGNPPGAGLPAEMERLRRIAHDLGNALTPVLMNLEVLRHADAAKGLPQGPIAACERNLTRACGLLEELDKALTEAGARAGLPQAGGAAAPAAGLPSPADARPLPPAGDPAEAAAGMAPSRPRGDAR